MEFRPGKMELRRDRRVCPRCGCLSASLRCSACRARTKPRIRIVWWVTGQRYRELTACYRVEEAHALIRYKEQDYWRQQRLGTQRPVGGSLADAIEAFARDKRWHSAEWHSQIRKALAPLSAMMGGTHQVQLISRQDIQRYLAEGLDQRSSSTMRSYLIVLRCFFRWLEAEGWVRHNPTEKIRLPPAESRGRQMDFVLPDEVARFVRACFEIDDHFGPVALAMMLGSFRKGELINLRHRDLDLKARWALVMPFSGDEMTSAWAPKTRSSQRAVPLHPLLAAVLSQVKPVVRPDGSVSPWLFPVNDQRKTQRARDSLGRKQPVVGDRRSPSTTFFGKKLRQALTAAGIDRRVTVHGLRRTFAVLLQETGAPLWVIRQAMGHADRGVTESYYLPRREQVLQQWVDRIEIGEPSISAHVAPRCLGAVAGEAQPARPRLIASP